MPWQHKICPRNQGARECYWAQPAHVLRDTGQPLNRYYMCHHWERKDPFLGQLDRQNRQAYLGLPKGDRDNSPIRRQAAGPGVFLFSGCSNAGG